MSSSVAKIAVFSDTHLHDLARGIPYLRAIMATYVPDAALVLHAGDLGDPEILLAFEGYPLHVVLGNTDPPTSSAMTQKVVACNAFRIGLVHGWGARREIERKVQQTFSDRPLDAIVYGHTHWPVCHRRDGVLLFNPGSCVDPRSAPHRTFGILEAGSTLAGRIVNVDRLAARFLG